MVLTRINHNVAAINAHRTLSGNSVQLYKSLERLSSGLRINRASDDAAGLSISEILRRQVNGTQQAVDNASNATNLINTSEAALDETTVLLQRIRQLSVQAANQGTTNSDMLKAIQSEIEAMVAEITRIGDNTQFAARNLLNGDHKSTATMLSAGGITIPPDPVNSTLEAGRHFMTITQTDPGSFTILNGADGVSNSNINPASIVGSTFDTGKYDIVVSEARAAAARSQHSGTFSAAGPIGLGTLAITTAFTGSDGHLVNLDVGDQITLSGYAPSGAPVAPLPALTMTGATTIQDIVNQVQAHYAGQATASWDAGNNQIILTDNVSGVSQTALVMNVTDFSNPAGSALDTAVVTEAGNFNDANVRIGGGDPVHVVAGQTVVIAGAIPANPNDPIPQVKVTFGALSDGTDIYQTSQMKYQGTLDGGEVVTFQNGDRYVRFRNGSSGESADGQQYTAGNRLTVNFDAEIDLLGGNSRTFALDAVNNALQFQIGPNAAQTVFVPIGDLRADNLGYVGETQTNGNPRTVAGINVTSYFGAEDGILICDQALAQVTDQRSALGALANRMESTMASLEIAKENLSSAESRIRDTDIAEETTQFTRSQILVQAGVSVLAQANLVPQSVLSLLQ